MSRRLTEVQLYVKILHFVSQNRVILFPDNEQQVLIGMGNKSKSITRQRFASLLHKLDDMLQFECVRK